MIAHYVSTDERNRRRAAGLCVECGDLPALPDASACAGCRKIVAARRREVKRMNKTWRGRHADVRLHRLLFG